MSQVGKKPSKTVKPKKPTGQPPKEFPSDGDYHQHIRRDYLQVPKDYEPPPTTGKPRPKARKG